MKRPVGKLVQVSKMVRKVGAPALIGRRCYHPVGQVGNRPYWTSRGWPWLLGDDDDHWDWWDEGVIAEIEERLIGGEPHLRVRFHVDGGDGEPYGEFTLGYDATNVWVQRLDPHRPTTDVVAPMVRALYARPGGSAGCCLHILLDDHNVDDRSAKFCLDYAREMGHADCILLAEHLLRMSRTQRSARLRR